MPRIVMEHIQYEPNVPPQGADGDKMFFVQVMRKNASAATPVRNIAPQGRSTGKPARRTRSPTPKPASTAGSA